MFEKRLPLKLLSLLMASLLLFSLSACGGQTAKAGDTYSLTIFATNDLHGHLGNMPVFSTIINDARKTTKNVLLLDAGDIFKRGPYESYGGKIETEIFNQMKYDALVLGNNEFKVPNGKSPDGNGTLAESDKQIADIIGWSKFPVLCANVTLKSDNKPIPGTKPYVVDTLNGVKIGIIGITNTEPGAYDMGKDKIFAPGDETVVKLLPEVKKVSDIQVVLSHAGMDINRKITDVSAIISGHDHILLDPPEVSNGIPIIQGGGENSLVLYRLDLNFKYDGKKWVLQDFTGKTFDGTDASVQKDPEVQKIIDNYTVSANAA